MSNSPLTPIRSPSYPVIPLADAVASVRKIEAQYRTSKVDRAIAAKIIGYSALSGPANKTLAALAQYGLVERAGKGEMRVTMRGRAILHPDSEAEKLQELRNAALEPHLFRELQERWPNMIPPEEGLVMYLNRKGFNQSAIRPAAKAYLQTLTFLEEEGANESHGIEPEDGRESPPSAIKPDDATMTHTATNPSTASDSARAANYDAIATAIVGPELNRIGMNIQGDKVLLNALLDINGVLDLEKKLQALKVLLGVYHAANDTGAGGELTDDGQKGPSG